MQSSRAGLSLDVTHHGDLARGSVVGVFDSEVYPFLIQSQAAETRCFFFFCCFFFPELRPLKAKTRDHIKRHPLLPLEPMMRVRLRISRCP